VIVLMEYQELPPDPLLKVAEETFGLSFLFPYQRLVIHNILEAAANPESSRCRQIVILPTGAGKSLCFSLPGVILPGGTLIIYPLLGLMADQARRFEEARLSCAVLRGGQTKDERRDLWSRWCRGEIKFLLTNPEALAGQEVQRELREVPPIHGVVDEAHTVVQWGDSFRPAYAGLGQILAGLGIRHLTAFTATASPTVLSRIRESLFLDEPAHLVMGNPDRENIHYSVIPTLTPDAELERLLSRQSPDALERPALVFCRSRDSARLTAAELRYRLGEREIYYYHAGLSREEKKRVEEWFFASEDGILAATCAYGMGIDKPDIRTVIHYSPPETVEAYLQEAGRGGRDRQPARAVLLTPPGKPGEAVTEGDKPPTPGPSPGILPPGAPLPDLSLSPDRCRREHLLSLMGADNQTCTGCDVCDGKVLNKPAGLHELTTFLRRHPRRFTKRQLRFLLAGRGSCELGEPELAGAPGRGLLDYLRPEDVETLIQQAREGGWVVLGNNGVVMRRKKRV